MSFHEVRFPATLSFGAVGGPERRTDIVTLANGFEERNTPWAHSRRRFDAGMGLRSLDDVDELLAFFEAREGQLHGFRWKDWSDYKSAAPSKAISSLDQIIFTGDEVTTDVQLIKTYTSGEESYARPIRKPVNGTVRISIELDELQDGIDYTVNPATGIVSFTHPPDLGAVVRAGYEFDIPVRFDIDHLALAVTSFQAGQVPSVPVVEVRL